VDEMWMRCGWEMGSGDDDEMWMGCGCDVDVEPFFPTPKVYVGSQLTFRFHPSSSWHSYLCEMI